MRLLVVRVLIVADEVCTASPRMRVAMTAERVSFVVVIPATLPRTQSVVGVPRRDHSHRTSRDGPPSARLPAQSMSLAGAMPPLPAEASPSRARPGDFRKLFQADLPCPVPRQEIFVFRFIGRCGCLSPSRLVKRDVRVVTIREVGSGGRERQRVTIAVARTRNCVVLAPRCWRQALRG